MRDAKDTATAELPTIDPPPQRMTIAQRLAHMGFQGPKQRPGCASCKHVEQTYRRPDTPFEADEWRCTRGGFPAQRMAICRDHAA